MSRNESPKNREDKYSDLDEYKAIFREDDFPSGDEELMEITKRIKLLPQEEPPTGMVNKILTAVEPKKPTLWVSLTNKLKSPVTFTFTPVKLMPAAVAILLALALVPQWMINGMVRQPVQLNTELKVPIVFTLKNSTAESVCVIGDFNSWDPEGYRMKYDRSNKTWTLEVLAPKGRHEYSFLINGRITIPDPKADFNIDDGFGNKNSVVFAGEKLAI